MPDKMKGPSVDPEGYQSCLVPKQGLQANFPTIGEREEDDGLYHSHPKGGPGAPATRASIWKR